jgi:iron complex outermembrane receptor protein
MSHHSRLRATLPLAVIALGLALPARAQTADPQPSTQADENPGDDQDIVVTGSYAGSLAAATETKRQAAYGVDSINSRPTSANSRRRTSPRRCSSSPA